MRLNHSGSGWAYWLCRGGCGGGGGERDEGLGDMYDFYVDHAF